MSLSVKEIVRLRGEAMRLKPAMKIGKAGLTPTVIAEIKNQLSRQKLLKIRLEISDRKARQAFAQEVAEASNAVFIGLTGRALVLFLSE